MNIRSVSEGRFECAPLRLALLKEYSTVQYPPKYHMIYSYHFMR